MCAACGKAAVRTGPRQLYCRPCSIKKDTDRKLKWSRANPQKRTAEESRQRESRAVIRGAEINSCERLDADNWYREPILKWAVRVSVPFSWSGSKNHIWSMARGGTHIFSRKRSKKFRSELSSAIKNAVGDRIVQNKVWIDVLIQKPNNRGDAANFIDIICDAVKDAIAVDDRWYSIRRLDWQIVKSNPCVFVGIGQEDVVASQACSHCGRILPFEKFWKNKGTKTGYGRSCAECMKKVPVEKPESA